MNHDEMSRDVTQEMMDDTLPTVKVMAEHGSKMAQFTLGEAYFHGWGVEKDHIHAAEWYRKSAEQGHAASQAALGVVYLNGEGVDQDFARAISWLQRAANQGDAIGQHALGKMCSLGIGVAINPKRGFRLFLRAADRGLEEAQYDVGMAYAEGKVVPTDIARAAHWFCQGAAQGHSGCQLQLFLMKECGVEIPNGAVLGRWASEKTVVPNSTAGSIPRELGSPDDESGGVSEEYVAMLSTIFENYKAAARSEARQRSSSISDE
jgi:hypothetical protein